eukprot:5686698-Pyramimonas_sp.AAC.1
MPPQRVPPVRQPPAGEPVPAPARRSRSPARAGAKSEGTPAAGQASIPKQLGVQRSVDVVFIQEHRLRSQQIPDAQHTLGLQGWA